MGGPTLRLRNDQSGNPTPTMSRLPIAFRTLAGCVGLLASGWVASGKAADWVPSVAPPAPYSRPATPGTSTTEYPNFSIGATGTFAFTDNVNLSPPGQEQSDFVLGVALPLGFRTAGPRLKVDAQYTPTIYVYARNGESDNLQNNLTSLASVEAVDDFLYVDATANIYQSYISVSYTHLTLPTILRV